MKNPMYNTEKEFVEQELQKIWEITTRLELELHHVASQKRN